MNKPKAVDIWTKAIVVSMHPLIRTRGGRSATKDSRAWRGGSTEQTTALRKSLSNHSLLAGGNLQIHCSARPVSLPRCCSETKTEKQNSIIKLSNADEEVNA